MQGFFFSLISRPSAKLCKQDFFPFFFGPCIPNISNSLYKWLSSLKATTHLTTQLFFNDYWAAEGNLHLGQSI